MRVSRAEAKKLRMVAEPATSTNRRRWVLYIEGWQPPRCNQWVGRHWSVKNRLRADMGTLLFLTACKAGSRPDVPAKCKRRLTLEIILGPRQRRSPDADAYDKLLKDALVGLGWLKDDSDKWLEYTRPVFSRGPQKATRITLEEIAQ